MFDMKDANDEAEFFESRVLHRFHVWEQEQIAQSVRACNPLLALMVEETWLR